MLEIITQKIGMVKIELSITVTDMDNRQKQRKPRLHIIREK